MRLDARGGFSGRGHVVGGARAEAWAGATSGTDVLSELSRPPSFQPATLTGNESAYQPNGAECYSCVGLSREACQGTAPPVVSCYNASDSFYKGCFDGNVTLTAGERAPEDGATGVVVAFLRPPGRQVSLYPKGSHLSNALWEL